MAEIKAPEKEIERLRKTGRNDDCGCGSSKKYKKCHLREDEEKERVYLAAVLAANEKAAEADNAAHDHDCEDPNCEEDHNKTAKKAVPKAGMAGGGRNNAPKGPSGASVANAQRSMPRKAS